jgi:hypothetical protein
MCIHGEQHVLSCFTRNVQIQDRSPSSFSFLWIMWPANLHVVSVSWFCSSVVTPNIVPQHIA